MSKEKQRTYNTWVSAKHQRVWFYDTPRTRKQIYAYKQDRGEYDETKKVVLVNYFAPSNVAERKAELQLQRLIRGKVGTSRCITTVENSYGKGYAKIQCLFLSQYQPSPETMSEIEELILKLGETAPFKIEETDDPYAKKLFKKQFADEQAEQELE